MNMLMRKNLLMSHRRVLESEPLFIKPEEETIRKESVLPTIELITKEINDIIIKLNKSTEQHEY